MALTDKLTAIADAIRGKTGGTEEMTLDEMAAAIAGIESGGGDIDTLIDGSITEITSNAESIRSYACYYLQTLTSINAPVAKNVGEYAFYNNTALQEVQLITVQNIGSRAFDKCSALTAVSFPLLTTTGTYVFNSCSKLENVNLPLLTSIGNNAFNTCSLLKNTNFPLVTSVGSSAFYSDRALEIIDFPVLSAIGSDAFRYCTKLTAFILRNVEVTCALSATGAFTSTPIASGTGYIYVPSALIEDYKVATNWTTYADQFRALEDYTVDGTTTGELDETKI